MQEGVVQHHSLWALRYIMMLWLSLVSMLPFDLAQFDDESEPGHAARSLELIGKTYLGKAGLERDGAALLLSRLYMRWVYYTYFLPCADLPLLGRTSNMLFQSLFAPLTYKVELGK